MSAAHGVILHHYDISPFSEKIRLILGLKGVGWASVRIPPVMPKPDLMPLTGGYRKTPVMQIGADVYCDTQLIADELERRYPAPTLFPGGHGLHRPAAMWADRTWFAITAALVFGVNADVIPDDFLKDRAAFSGRSTERAALKAGVEPMRIQWAAAAGWIDETLADGRAFLTGKACGLADFSACMNVWFLKTLCPQEAGLADRPPRLSEWAARMAAWGHGTRAEITAAEALEIAARASPQPAEATLTDDMGILRPGDLVTIVPDDTGRVPVTGTLVGADRARIVIRRRDERVGDVHLHFPRTGFFVRKSA